MKYSIDVDFDFTTDTENYWELNNDPDAYSPTLKKYHQILWQKKLPNNEFFSLNIGNSSYNYLYWKNFRFGADSIINMYTHHKNAYIKKVLLDVKKRIKDYDQFRKEYIKKSYTIGGNIIFPKNGVANSINVARGRHPKIMDRFDLTLECIRRYYNNETSPLTTVLNNNSEYFHLFNSFRGYVEFFYLQDLVIDDYSKVNFYLNFNDFLDNPYPSNADEWLILYNNQMDFLRKRNQRIDSLFR